MLSTSTSGAANVSLTVSPTVTARGRNGAGGAATATAMPVTKGEAAPAEAKSATHSELRKAAVRMVPNGASANFERTASGFLSRGTCTTARTATASSSNVAPKASVGALELEKSNDTSDSATPAAFAMADRKFSSISPRQEEFPKRRTASMFSTFIETCTTSRWRKYVAFEYIPPQERVGSSPSSPSQTAPHSSSGRGSYSESTTGSEPLKQLQWPLFWRPMWV
mmetsp:Transcript_4645/g.10231  ORF Transcript_4645/g.10231 Transcript_4645/m.10231 type:complete len:224 (-) Transcript_4645:409-1080(-)